MKRSVLIIVTSFVALAFNTALFAGGDNTLITHTQGSPMIVRNGVEVPAEMGSVCQTNDILKTADGCMVDVALNGKIGCRILPLSEVLLANADDQNMHLKVNSGNVILNVEKLAASSFKVETPTAIATVRGTQFWGRVLDATDPNPSTTFAVLQGSITVYSKTLDQTFDINEGQALDIPNTLSEEAVVTVRSALTDELKAMEQASSVKTSA